MNAEKKNDMEEKETPKPEALGGKTLSAETQAALNAASEHQETDEKPEDEVLMKKKDIDGVRDAIIAALGKDKKQASEEATDDDETTEEAPTEEASDAVREQLLRTAAELENLRKRSERELADARKYAVTGFARDLVSVAENLQLAMKNITEEDRKKDEKINNLAQGVELTYNEMIRVFQGNGIVRIDPIGEKFNHNHHQAVAQVEDNEAEPGTIIQVLQAGYIIHDRLLRPAMVTVAKAGDKAESVDTEA